MLVPLLPVTLARGVSTHVLLGTAPQCAPVHRIATATHQTAPAPQGFAENATGGVGGPHVQVTSLADSGEGTLRVAATAEGPSVVEFAVNGTIRLDSPIMVTANKTISGRSAAITITGAGLNMSGVSNVIIECLTVKDAAEDAISVRDGATDIVLRHLTLGPCGDGLLDVTMATNATLTRVSVEHCLFDGGDKVMLVGASNDALNDANLAISISHSWFRICWQRTPRLRFGRAHIWNCLYSDWGGYAVSSGFGGRLLVESSVFRAGERPEASKVMDAVLGALRGESNALEQGAFVTDQSPELVPRNASTWYDYDCEQNTTLVALDVEANAGWHLRAAGMESVPPSDAEPPAESPAESPAAPPVAPPVELTANQTWACLFLTLLIISGVSCKKRRCPP